MSSSDQTSDCLQDEIFMSALHQFFSFFNPLWLFFLFKEQDHFMQDIFSCWHSPSEKVTQERCDYFCCNTFILNAEQSGLYLFLQMTDLSLAINSQFSSLLLKVFVRSKHTHTKALSFSEVNRELFEIFKCWAHF